MTEELRRSRVRVKLGDFEVEYEGDNGFLVSELPKVVVSIAELRNNVPRQAPPAPGNVGNGKISGTVAAIAAKLSVDGGSELIVAAVAKKSFVDGVELVSRKDLLDAMKSASNYYRQTYSNNLSSYLKKLLADSRLTEPSEGHYALTASEKARLEPVLLAG